MELQHELYHHHCLILFQQRAKILSLHLDHQQMLPFCHPHSDIDSLHKVSSHCTKQALYLHIQITTHYTAPVRKVFNSTECLLFCKATLLSLWWRSLKRACICGHEKNQSPRYVSVICNMDQAAFVAECYEDILHLYNSPAAEHESLQIPSLELCNDTEYAFPSLFRSPPNIQKVQALCLAVSSRVDKQRGQAFITLPGIGLWVIPINALQKLSPVRSRILAKNRFSCIFFTEDHLAFTVFIHVSNA